MGEVEQPKAPQGGAQRRVLESFLAFLDDEGYCIRRREEDDPEFVPLWRQVWIEEFFAQAKQEGW